MINRLQLFSFFVIIVAVKIKVVFVQQESETRMINPTKMALFSFGQFCSLFIVTVLLIQWKDVALGAFTDSWGRMSEFSHINHCIKQKRKKHIPHTHNFPCSDVRSPFGLCPNSSVHQTLPYPPLWWSTLVRLQPCFFKIKPRSNP